MDRDELKNDENDLTPQQLWREIRGLKELVFSKIADIEKSIEVAHHDAVRVPTEIQKQVGALKELHEEKFKTVDMQFNERDIRLNESFKAQQDANTKTELSFTKQIDACNDKIGENKDRVIRLEGAAAGVMLQKTETRSNVAEQKTSYGLIAAIVFGIIGVLTGIISIGIALNK